MASTQGSYQALSVLIESALCLLSTTHSDVLRLSEYVLDMVQRPGIPEEPAVWCGNKRPNHKTPVTSMGPCGMLLGSRGVVPIPVLAGISEGCPGDVTYILSAKGKAGFSQPAEDGNPS